MKPDLFKAILAMSKLKHRKRKGWLLRGVKNPESVAEHSWRSAMIALAIASKGYDTGKIAKMAVLHDISEIFGEDYTPIDGITKEQKEKMERKTLRRFLNMLPEDAAKEWEMLWEEADAQKTKEAKLVKDAEIIEMVFQALEYEKTKNFKKDLTEFLIYDRKRLKTKIAKKLFNEIKKAWPKSALKKFDAKKYSYYY